MVLLSPDFVCNVSLEFPVQNFETPHHKNASQIELNRPNSGEGSTSFSKEVPLWEPCFFLDGFAIPLQSVLWVVVFSSLCLGGWCCFLLFLLVFYIGVYLHMKMFYTYDVNDKEKNTQYDNCILNYYHFVLFF